VVNVSWDDAKAYIAWLNTRVHAEVYRLPSEAEREYATRAQAMNGSRTEFFTGVRIEPSQAQFNWNSSYAESRTRPNGAAGTAEAESYPPPNTFGLYNMHGNVWEWVEDCYKDSYNGAPRDGTAVIWDKCPSRVLRGGSWDSIPRSLRSSFRLSWSPNFRCAFLGFRVARTL